MGWCWKGQSCTLTPVPRSPVRVGGGNGRLQLTDQMGHQPSQQTKCPNKEFSVESLIWTSPFSTPKCGKAPWAGICCESELGAPEAAPTRTLALVNNQTPTPQSHYMVKTLPGKVCGRNPFCPEPQDCTLQLFLMQLFLLDISPPHTIGLSLWSSAATPNSTTFNTNLKCKAWISLLSCILKKWGGKRKSSTIFHLGNNFENKQSLITHYLAPAQ